MKLSIRHREDLEISGGWIGVIDSRFTRGGLVALFKNVTSAAAFVDRELPAGILVEVNVPE